MSNEDLASFAVRGIYPINGESFVTKEIGCIKIRSLKAKAEPTMLSSRCTNGWGRRRGSSIAGREIRYLQMSSFSEVWRIFLFFSRGMSAKCT